MLKIFKNKKAQNTAEYAILIAIVVGSVIAMQTYAQRTMQGRIRDANVLFRDQTGNLGKTLQYEPYYSNSSSKTDRSQTATETFKAHSKTSTTQKAAADGTDYVDRTEYNRNAVVSVNGEDGTNLTELGF